MSFNETGLPTGFEWTVSLEGLTQTSALKVISFYAPNGSYNFSIARIYSFLISPVQGVVQVTGNSVNRSITFTENKLSYIVAFVSHGLPARTEWSVTLRKSSEIGYPFNETLSTHNNTIATNLSNGSYIYSLGRLNNFNSTQSFGYLNVNGSDLILHINWTKKPNSFLAQEFIGLPVLEWIQFILVAATILGFILSGELIRKLKK
jgi:hypothetical protein